MKREGHTWSMNGKEKQVNWMFIEQKKEKEMKNDKEHKQNILTWKDKK